jgi:hypothetical protein
MPFAQRSTVYGAEFQHEPQNLTSLPSPCRRQQVARGKRWTAARGFYPELSPLWPAPPAGPPRSSRLERHRERMMWSVADDC